jgi:hypothetical protein
MVDTIGKSHRHPVGRHYAVAAPSYTSAWRQAAGLVTVLSDRLRFKTHNIGSLATTINRGYCGRDTRLNCGPLRSVSSSDAGKTTAELKVRIQLPPADSLVSRRNSPVTVEKPRFSTGLAGWSSRRGRQRRAERGNPRQRAMISLSSRIPVPHRRCGWSP